jgi:hypothetical protein
MSLTEYHFGNLTPQQCLFVAEYCRPPVNAARAYRAAGYSGYRAGRRVVPDTGDSPGGGMGRVAARDRARGARTVLRLANESEIGS